MASFYDRDVASNDILSAGLGSRRVKARQLPSIETASVISISLTTKFIRSGHFNFNDPLIPATLNLVVALTSS